MKNKIALLVYVVLFILVGCSTEEENAKIAGSNELGKLDQSSATKAEKKVESLDEVTNSVALLMDNELIVAFKVKHFERFHLKKIEKKVKDLVENEFPSYQTTVSSDLKIFLETEKLKGKFTSNKLSKKKADKEFTKIIKLSEEQT